MPNHEFAHAYVADRLGAHTARNMNRLNINPFYHIDPLGALCLLLVGFGWAKPVRSTQNFKNPKRDMRDRACGPTSNILSNSDYHCQ
jgi:Zn-dependent protease